MVGSYLLLLEGRWESEDGLFRERKYFAAGLLLEKQAVITAFVLSTNCFCCHTAQNT